ncbi:Retrovirus-related Pol polyprotein from transposon 17.6, partial [Araneus ventricosus]
NLKKCSFARPHVKYLGHVIGSGRHQPDSDKTNTIENLPQPKTKKELLSVLGLCNYYREYIPNYSELVYPLKELTKKKVPDNIPWTKEHDLTFDRLKRALVEAPSLYTPRPDQPFIVHSDASQIGVAACLSQRAGEKCCPIAYASQKLTRCQQSWSTIEREAFAIVWCLKKFEVWVYGSEIEFYTDHNPLPFLTKGAPQSARLLRWGRTPRVDKTLKILQCNINGISFQASRVKLYQLLDLAERLSAQIVALQETKLRKTTLLKVRAYSVFRTDRGDANGGGLALLIRDIKYRAIDIQADEDTDTEIQGISFVWRDRLIKVFNVYHPPNNKQLQANFNNITGENIIILGYLNAKHPMWGCATQNTRGNELVNFVDDGGFIVLNDGIPHTLLI